MGTRAKDGTSVWFRNIARGKRAIALDLKDTAQKDTFLKLADDAEAFCLAELLDCGGDVTETSTDLALQDGLFE